VIQDIIHWLIHDLTPSIIALVQAHPMWCFPIAFLVAFCESFIVIAWLVPGTVILLAMGAVVGASHIGFMPAFFGAVIGSMIGDWIVFWLAQHYHHQILHVWPLKKFEPAIEKGLHYFNRWGVWGVFFGRFTGPMRSSVPIVAGMSEMSIWKFQSANLAATLIWAAALLAPGVVIHPIYNYFFG